MTNEDDRVLQFFVSKCNVLQPTCVDRLVIEVRMKVTQHVDARAWRCGDVF